MKHSDQPAPPARPKSESAVGWVTFDVALVAVAGTAATALAQLIGGEFEWKSLAVAGLFSGLIGVAAWRNGWSLATYLRGLRGSAPPPVDKRGRAPD
jgi:hypothetical protein